MMLIHINSVVNMASFECNNVNVVTAVSLLWKLCLIVDEFKINLHLFIIKTFV